MILVLTARACVRAETLTRFIIYLWNQKKDQFYCNKHKQHSERYRFSIKEKYNP